MTRVGERFGVPSRIDRLAYTRDDWVQEARLADELSRRQFRTRYGYGRKTDEARYAATSAYRACVSLWRAEQRRPPRVTLVDEDLSWDPIPWLEARSELDDLATREAPALTLLTDRYQEGRPLPFVQLRRLRRKA